MRVLHILDHSLPLHSGYAFRSHSIFKAQANRGWQVAAVTSPKHQQSWKAKCEPQESVEGFPHFRTPLSVASSTRGYYEIRLMLALYRRILEVTSMVKPDVIHAHSPVLNALPALRVGKQMGIPVVYEVRAFWEDAAVDHGSYHEGSWKYRLVRMLETRVCRKSDHVAVLCDGLRKELIDRGIPDHKLTIVPNGVNTEEFKERTADKGTASMWNLDKGSAIGFVGSFYRYEGLDLLLDAFAMLAQKYKNCSLVLVGGGEVEAFLKDKIQTVGLKGRVIMPGRVDHERIPAIYALLDILVYPRYSMRLTELVTPLKPLEAMAMGKAVIASNVGGHQELIRDGETGLLFPAGDVSALASALERLLLDQRFRLALGRRAQTWVAQARTWDKIAATYENIYSKVLAKSGICRPDATISAHALKS